MRTTIYGIKNCDTMKKARAWLDAHGVEHDFHDYKAEGVDRAKLEAWAKIVGWEVLLNRAGTTFRKLPDEAKQNIDEREGDQAHARAALHDQAAGARARPNAARGFYEERYSAIR